MLLQRKSGMALLASAVALCVWSGTAVSSENEKEEKGEEAKGGAVTGVVTRKGDNWIEVKAEGAKEPRRYIPHWREGGLDKEMLAKIHGVPVNSVVKLTWKFEEHARVVAIDIIKRGEPERKEGGDRKEGGERREGERKEGGDRKEGGERKEGERRDGERREGERREEGERKRQERHENAGEKREERKRD